MVDKFQAGFSSQGGHLIEVDEGHIAQAETTTAPGEEIIIVFHVSFVDVGSAPGRNLTSLALAVQKLPGRKENPTGLLQMGVHLLQETDPVFPAGNVLEDRQGRDGRKSTETGETVAAGQIAGVKVADHRRAGPFEKGLAEIHADVASDGALIHKKAPETPFPATNVKQTRTWLRQVFQETSEAGLRSSTRAGEGVGQVGVESVVQSQEAIGELAVHRQGE